MHSGCSGRVDHFKENAVVYIISKGFIKTGKAAAIRTANMHFDCHKAALSL